MNPEEREPTRRALFRAAGLGLGAAVAAEAAPGRVLAAAAAIATPSAPLWTREYWTKKGQVSLYLYRKRRSGPSTGAAPLPVLLLARGSSVSSRPSFDLSVPGAGEYSLMNVFAHLGYDVWTLDFAGYGRSTATEGNSDIATGVEDLRAATALIAQETGQRRPHLFGESSGGLRAGAFAVAEPDRVGRLVFAAFTYTGQGSPTLKDRAKQVEFYRTHNRRTRDLAMIRSIFTRDKPGTSDPRVPEAIAAAELPFGDTVPTGTYLDMTANLPVVDPAKLKAPVMLVRGEYDGIASETDLLDFLHRLPNEDRQYAVIPGAAHSLVWSLNRRGLWHVMHSFLTMPPHAEV